MESQWQPPQVAGVLAGLLAACCLVALVTPWWTLSVGGFDLSAKPFDGNNIANDSGPIMGGVLIVVALLSAIACSGILFAQPRLWKLATLLAAVAAFLVALVALLAVVSWPQNGLDFWGENGAIATYASFGWYFACVTALFGAFTALRIAACTKARRAVPDPTARPDGRFVGPGPK